MTGSGGLRHRPSTLHPSARQSHRRSVNGEWELSHIKALVRERDSTRRTQPAGEEEGLDQEDERDMQPDSNEEMTPR